VGAPGSGGAIAGGIDSIGSGAVDLLCTG
jgi:hypothetical protein